MPDPTHPLAVAFHSFSASAGEYDQVRWLDGSGRERLKIDNRDGIPVVAPAADLVDKSRRPYYTVTRALPPSDVYVSDLDLDVEGDTLKEPFHPSLRVAQSVPHPTADMGIVVINARADRLLAQLRSVANEAGFSLLLVNREGQWIIGPSPDVEWGWHRGRSDDSLAATQPDLWQAMQRKPRGTVDGWTFATVTSHRLTSLNRTTAKMQGDDLGLRVLVREIDQTQSPGLRWKAILILLTLVGIGVAAGFVLRTARSFARERAYSKRLHAANAALQQSNADLVSVQADLARAERLSSLGLMVAGVAHEMNTPLGSAGLALSSAQTDLVLLAERIDSGIRRSELDRFLAAVRDALELASSELRRAAGLVQRFKQVAVDRTTWERRRFDLAEAIMDADIRLRRKEGLSDVTVDLDLEPDLTMESFPGPLEQVVANLFGNALTHAVSEDRLLQVTIASRSDGPDHVCIEVRDNGPGIGRDLLRRVFEPFFTTRRHAGGTGLGLHIVHEIVTQVLGGRIHVESHSADDAPADEQGTSFRLRLPRRAPERLASGDADS